VPSISQADLDQMIFSFVKTQWRKTALIIAEVLHQGDERQKIIAPQRIANRIISLCDAGALESQGLLSNWRHSEVRLPAKSQESGTLLDLTSGAEGRDR
jgi:hypothetical protein